MRSRSMPRRSGPTSCCWATTTCTPRCATPCGTPEPVAAAGLSPAELEAAVVERAAEVPDGAVARLFVDGADPQAWRLLDHARIAEAAGHALWFRVEPTFL